MSPASEIRTDSCVFEHCSQTVYISIPDKSLIFIEGELLTSKLKTKISVEVRLAEIFILHEFDWLEHGQLKLPHKQTLSQLL